MPPQYSGDKWDFICATSLFRFTVSVTGLSSWLWQLAVVMVVNIKLYRTTEEKSILLISEFPLFSDATETWIVREDDQVRKFKLWFLYNLMCSILLSCFVVLCAALHVALDLHKLLPLVVWKLLFLLIIHRTGCRQFPLELFFCFVKQLKTAHSELCGSSKVTLTLILEKDVAVEFFQMSFLSTTSPP